MGIHGTWFVATPEQAARAFRVRRSEGINAFTRQPVMVDHVDVDLRRLMKYRSVERKFLLASYVGALFGPGEAGEVLTPKGSEESLHRVPRAKVEALVASAPSREELVATWRTNLALLGDAPYVKDLDDALAVELYELARAAAATPSATIYGYVW